MTFAGALDTSTGVQVRSKLVQLGCRRWPWSSERGQRCGPPASV